MEDSSKAHLKPAAANSGSGSGKPLPSPLRHRFEATLGADLSKVKVHESHAPTLLGAESFSKGNDIYFAPKSYDPFSPKGEELLSHELTHVVQQGAGKKGGLSKDKEAETLASKVTKQN